MFESLRNNMLMNVALIPLALLVFLLMYLLAHCASAITSVLLIVSE